jgi:hypothetical protein
MWVLIKTHMHYLESHTLSCACTVKVPLRVWSKLSCTKPDPLATNKALLQEAS